jgi:hypothetical protein
MLLVESTKKTVLRPRIFVVEKEGSLPQPLQRRGATV